MADATSDPSGAPIEVLRVHRLEVVDGAGETRAVLGNLASDDEEFWPGLSVRDAAGRERLWAMVHDLGPEIGLAAGGNTVLVVAAHDAATEAAEPGARLTLCDPSGDVVAEWRVDPDGNLRVSGAEA